MVAQVKLEELLTCTERDVCSTFSRNYSSSIIVWECPPSSRGKAPTWRRSTLRGLGVSIGSYESGLTCASLAHIKHYGLGLRLGLELEPEFFLLDLCKPGSHKYIRLRAEFELGPWVKRAMFGLTSGPKEGLITSLLEFRKLFCHNRDPIGLLLASQAAK